MSSYFLLSKVEVSQRDEFLTVKVIFSITGKIILNHVSA
jgi:hypothetical protein